MKGPAAANHSSSPAISIVTPSFNQARFIDATIQSVLSQDYPILQYLIVDGGSTDGTLEILQQYEGRLTWISQPDRGQADAINKGFASIGGEILAWLNSDDAYAPGALSAVARTFAENPTIGLVYGNADFIDAGGNFIAPCAHIEPFDRGRLLRYSDYLVQPAVFFRREVFLDAGGLDASLNWAMDYDLWLAIARRSDFLYLRQTLAHYRWLASSKTASSGRERIDEVRKVALRHGSRGLPAFFQLESIRLRLAESAALLRAGRPVRAMAVIACAAAELLAAPRAILSLLRRQTWRIIATGQTLRSRAKNSDSSPPAPPSR